MDLRTGFYFLEVKSIVHQHLKIRVDPLFIRVIRVAKIRVDPLSIRVIRVANMTNLLDSVKQYLTPELIGQASELLGESPDGVSKAANGFIPAILAGLLQKTGDAHAIGSIFSLLSGFDAGVLDHPAGLVGGGNLAHNDPKDAAGHLLGLLFGAKVPAMTNSIAAFSGVKSSSASSLLGLVGPLVMGVLSKKISGEGLGVSGLANLLMGEQKSILGALPGGLASVLGLVNPAAAAVPTETVETAVGTRWLWPLLLLLGLGFGIMYYMKNCATPAMPQVKTETPAVDSSAIKAAEMAASAQAAASYFSKKLASGFEIKGNPNGIENQLIAFIEDASKPVDKTTWFNFDRLTFNTGSAVIDMDKSREQLTNIYEILKAYPKVKLKVGGYTDNVGKEPANLKLSTDRAKATVAALQGMGIEKGRLSPEGYGSQHPVASNETEEGRAQNRRIAVRVTEK
ncbi:MAG TPA: OmpA family protein [Saprospiraceae bacterium]|nr:OmpA family protein [Saprospiraceae bacterium]